VTLDPRRSGLCRRGDLNSDPLTGFVQTRRAGRAHGVITRDAPRRRERDSGVMLRSAKCPRESAKRGVRTRITDQCFRTSAGIWAGQATGETESGVRVDSPPHAL
jgi:hypothetical protein